MGPFEYFIIFYVIIIGLAIEAIAKNFYVLLAAGRGVRWHWMAPVNALTVTITAVAQFFLFWQLRAHYHIENFLYVLSPVTSMIVLFLVALAVLPDEVPPEGLDLKTWYFDNRARFWLLNVALMVAFAVANVLVLVTAAVSGPEPIVFLIENGALAVVFLSLAYAKAVWWHSLCIATLFVMEIVTYAGLRLG